MADWLIQPRDPQLRRSVSPVTLPSKLVVSELYNLPGTAQITAARSSLAPLMQPGWGAIISRDGQQRFSGLVDSIDDDDFAMPTVTLVSDLVHLYDRGAWPTPGADWDAQTADYDVRSGAAEDVILGYVSANAGPATIAARRIPSLALPTSQGRGPSSPTSARYDNLLTLVAGIAEAAGLRLDLVHDETTGTPRLLFTITSVQDVSGTVRFGSPTMGGPLVLSPWSTKLTAPKATIEIVAGGGEGASRIIRGLSHDTDAEALWGRRIENFVDQRQTTDTAQLDKAGSDQLAQDAGTTSVTSTAADAPGLGYGTRWRVGYRVGLDFGGLATSDIVRGVTFTVTRDPSGQVQDEQIAPSIGSSDATKTSVTQRQLAKALRQISALQRKQ